MNDIKKYISSGIIEMYVLGLASEEDIREINSFSVIYPEIQEEIDAISKALEVYNETHKKHSIKVKPLIMAIIDYTERLKNGEAPVEVPALNEWSKIGDFEPWLSRPDMVLDSEDDAYARIIGYSPETMTAIAWLRNEMPYEVHELELEKILVVEGSCEIILSDKIIPLNPGDFYAIPLHMGHTIRIISDIPCKVILQRSAA